MRSPIAFETRRTSSCTGGTLTWPACAIFAVHPRHDAPMRFSLSLPLLRDPSSPDPFRETFELARIAEEAGFDTATIGHHHFLPGNMADPLTFLAAVAARTDTPRGGTGIFQLPVHNPVRGAEQVATIDQGSGGRVSPGVRLGWGAPGDEGPRAG